MKLDLDGRSALSIDSENETARYECSRTLEASVPAAASGPGTRLRLVLELRRNLGGMMMRAQLGAEFVTGVEAIRYVVCVTDAEFDSGIPATCASVIGKPLIPGLPTDFAQAVLTGISAELPSMALPPGLLRVDRAGYDLMGSSETAFYQCAMLLRGAFAATVAGADVASTLRDLVGKTPVQ